MIPIMLVVLTYMKLVALFQIGGTAEYNYFI